MPVSPRAICALIQRVLYVLPLFLPLYTVRFHVGPLPTTLLEVVLLVLFSLYSVQAKWSGWRAGWERLGAWCYPMIGWSLVALIAIFVAPDPVAGLGLWRAYVLEPLLVFVIIADVLRSEEDLVCVRKHFFISVCLLGAWALVQFLTGSGIPHPWDVSIHGGRRATGPFPFPNALALFVAPLTIWAFFTWMEERKDYLAFATSLVGIGAMLLARSQGGLLAVVCIGWLGLD